MVILIHSSTYILGHDVNYISDGDCNLKCLENIADEVINLNKIYDEPL